MNKSDKIVGIFLAEYKEYRNLCVLYYDEYNTASGYNLDDDNTHQLTRDFLRFLKKPDSHCMDWRWNNGNTDKERGSVFTFIMPAELLKGGE